MSHTLKVIALGFALLARNPGRGRAPGVVEAFSRLSWAQLPQRSPS